MRKFLTLSAALILLSVTSVSAQREFLSNYGVSANAGLSGFGFSVSTALHKNINVRLGYEGGLASYKYTVDDLGEIGHGIAIPDLDLKAKLKGSGFHMLFDYTPFKEGMGAFHLTAGFYAGGSKMVEVTGQFDESWIETLDMYGIDPSTELAIDFGDSKVYTDARGSMKAYAEVSSFKPYIGLGWGNAIPKGRVGFRFDVGVMFHGKPKIKSPNTTSDLNGNEELNDVNEIIGKIRVWPQMTFQLTYRLLKEEKYRKNK